MRSGAFGTILMVVAAMTMEVALHWYAGTGGTPLANRLASAYLHRDPDNHKAYVAGVVDLVAPAILLGVGLGFFGAAWPPRYLVSCVPILAVGLIALFPLYARFFPNGGAHWWSPLDATPVTLGAHVVALMKALVLCGSSTYLSSIVTQHFRHPSDR